MVRKGERAEVMNCKKAETLKPVAACIQRPRKGEVRDGCKNIQVVKEAMVVSTELIGSIPVRVKDIRKAAVNKKQIIPKEMHCKNVKKDITLKMLFQRWEEF